MRAIRPGPSKQALCRAAPAWRRRGFSHRRLARRHAADADQHELRADAGARLPQQRRRNLEQRHAGKPAAIPRACALFSDAGRAMVVLLTISPSMPDASDDVAISSSACGSTSGAILRSSGVR